MSSRFSEIFSDCHDCHDFHEAVLKLYSAGSIEEACRGLETFLRTNDLVSHLEVLIEERGACDQAPLYSPVEPRKTEGQSAIPNSDETERYEISLPSGSTLRIEASLSARSTPPHRAILDMLLEHLSVYAKHSPLRPLPDLRALSPRETEVFSLVREGKSNPEIGAALGISHRTVEKHVTALLRNFACENRYALIANEYRTNG